MTEIFYGAAVLSDNGYHVRFNFHAGLPGSRGLSGEDLCLTKEEFEDMVRKLKMEVRPFV
jgi:hypothetical protein